jgi:hypothetical protein
MVAWLGNRGNKMIYQDCIYIDKVKSEILVVNEDLILKDENTIS